MEHIVWIMCAIIYNGLSTAADLPCNKRAAQYGYVCVCDGSYCDTVERPPTLPPGQFHRYTTSSISPGFTRSLGYFSHFSSDAEYTFTINTSKPRQEIHGIGGSFTDTVGVLVNGLSEPAQDKFMKSYFGPSGIEHSMARLPIGSSDFSPRSYTFDDVPFEDLELKYFNLTYEDINFKIPLIKKAVTLSERGIKLIGCTWDAPAWMKLDNESYNAYVGQNFYSAWAQYHVKFLDAYKKEGLEFWGLSGGNELLLSYVLQNIIPIVSMVTQQRDWFKNHLKPQLVAANYSQVKLITLEDQRMFAPYWMDRFAGDPEAYNAMDAIGLHWYFDRIISPSVLDDLHYKYPDKQILYTEASMNSAFSIESVQLGSWDRAAAYANSIIETLNHWSQSYLDWNLALNTEGGPCLEEKIDAPVIINTTSGEFYKQPIFYAVGHFSKFIPPGSRVVQVTRDQPDTNKSGLYPPFKQDNIFETVIKFMEDTIPIVLPNTVQCTASANSDGSYSIFLLNLGF